MRRAGSKAGPGPRGARTIGTATPGRPKKAASTSPATTWLERLAKTGRGHRWLKGAVNHDEDLHFSTYYLRASCASVTAPLYPGYSFVVASYEGFNETYYLLEEECRDSAVAIVEKALRQPRWLSGILHEIRRRSDALEGIFDADTSPERLAALSDSGLLALYRRHDARNRALYKHARLPEALDRGVSYFTEYLMEHLRGRGLGPAECAEAFSVLSEPVVPSVLAQEMVEFEKIVAYARSKPGALPPAAEGASRARMLLEPGLRALLDAHREKWQFLPYHGYGRRELATLDHYLRRLLDEARGTGAGLTPRAEGAGRERQALLERLKLDATHAALFDVYPEIGAAKLYRRHAQLRNFYFLDMLLAEIARRLHVSEWTIRCMLPEEVMASLRGGRLVDAAIEQRLGGCVFAIVDGEERVVTGAEADAARALCRPVSRPKAEPNVLHGVVASRGKVAGPAKVVIRADDCRDGLPAGTILVSESTDPDLVRLLRSAGGVLTEQGGVTSHAAIICRELGVPTIIGIDGLLESVNDGDWIEMDAERGVVTLSPSPAARGRAERTASADPAVIGPKAYSLELVRSLGFRVPELVVLDFERVRAATDQPDGPACRELVQEVLARLSAPGITRLAVRSSAVSEDADGGSAAGEYRSVLDVSTKDLLEALREFVARNGPRSGRVAYRGSVIVQHMVDAEVAGVCLTRDRRTGNRNAVILEMTAGGNTGVTGGTVRPDRLVIDRLTGDILDEVRSRAVATIDATGMVQQFLRLEAQLGKPLDIEWAVAGRELYILQARPIVVRARRGGGTGPRGEV